MQVLDVSKLRLVGRTPSMTSGGGDSAGDMAEIYVTPEGRQVTRESDGSYRIVVPGTDDKHATGTMYSFDANGNLSNTTSVGGGSFWENTVGRQGLGQIGTDIANDKKLIAFLATAAAGAYASQAAAAGGAGGTGGVGAAGSSGAGYAPIEASAGIGEAGGVGSYGATGVASSAAPGAVPGVSATQAAGGVGAASSAGGGGGSGINTGNGQSFSDAGYSAQNGLDYSGGTDGLLDQIKRQYGEPALEWIKQNYGDVAKFAASNPNLLTALAGGALGYAANKDDSTATVSTSIDPTALAYRDSVLSQLQGELNPANMPKYDGQTTYTAATNPFVADENPYLTSMIDAGAGDMSRYYDQFIAPKFSAGSSFGSSGLGFMELAERDNQARQMRDMATNLRFQDHNMRAGLAEQGAARTDQSNQFNINTGTKLFQDYQNAQNQRINSLVSAGSMPGNKTQTVTTQGNPWAGLMGGIITGANLWGTK